MEFKLFKNISLLLLGLSIVSPSVYAQSSTPARVELQQCLQERPNVCKFKISGQGSQLLLKKKLQNPIKVTLKGRTVFVAQQYKFLAASENETLMLAKGSWLVGSDLQRALRARKISNYRLLVSRKKIINSSLMSTASYSQSAL